MIVALPAWAEDLRPAPGRYFVALVGNDAWSGMLPAPNAQKTDGPFATLARARDEIRAQKPVHPAVWRTGFSSVTVLVREGTYYLPEPLRFTPEDSGTEECPITYAAYPNEHAVISAGRRITGWTTKDGKIYTAYLSEVKDSKWFFRQLRVGDERQTRARTPNFDPKNPYTGGYLLFAGGKAGQFGYGMGGVQDVGTWLECTVEVPAAGGYVCWVYYANSGETNKKFFGHTDMSGRTTLSVDGGVAVPLADMNDTGSFYSGFRWARTATISLSPGRHVLRWTNEKGGGLSLDAFALCDDPSYTPKVVDDVNMSEPSAGKHLVWFQAESYSARHGEHPYAGVLLRKPSPESRTTLRFTPGALAPMPNSPDAEVFVIPEWDWVSEIVHLDSLDPERGIAKVSGANGMKPMVPGNRFFVENALEALDQPGEWCLNRQTGILTYWPKRKDFAEAGVVAPVFDRAIEFCGDGAKRQYVSYIRIEGLTFTDTGFAAPETVHDVYFACDAAVWLRSATNCRIASNVFRDVGGYAVTLAGPSSENEIIGNHIVGAGQGGVFLNGIAEEMRKPAPRSLRPYHNLVAGNYIHHCGAFYKHVAGVYLSHSYDNVIAHNLITDMPRYGLSLKHECPGNRVEFNEVRRTNLETQDTGAIEMSENKSGSVVNNNFVVDSVGCGFDGKRGRLAAPFASCGIYLDNVSSRAVVTNNIVVRTSGGIWLNLGSDNIIQNNIFVEALERQLNINLAPDSIGNKVQGNIFCWADPKTPLFNLGGWKPGAQGLFCDGNLIHIGSASPVIGGIGKSPEESWAAWRKAGMDQNSFLADPLFADPAKDDYRLKPDSPAFNLGFQPIPVEKIGLKGYERSWKGADAK
jgi:parallel beta-helix repeat protein